MTFYNNDSIRYTEAVYALLCCILMYIAILKINLKMYLSSESTLIHLRKFNRFLMLQVVNKQIM